MSGAGSSGLARRGMTSLAVNGRRQAQRAYKRLRPWMESVGEIRSGDPAAAAFGSFGERSRIAHPQVALVNPWGMALGDDVYIRSYFILEAYTPPGTVVVRFGNRIELGHYVRVVAFNGIELEDLVGIGHGCTLADSVHDWKSVQDDENHPLWMTPAKQGRTLRIARGAFLGNNVIVAGGVTIGEWAIVDHNSVISRDVPPRSIVGGSPARVLRIRRDDGSWESLADPPLLRDYEPATTAQ